MKRTKRRVGISLVFIGLTLISIPFIYEWQQNQKLGEFEKALAMISDGGEADNTEFSEADLTDVYELEIPAIDLEQKVMAETNEKNLAIALTQIKPNQQPGKGNFTIAGHRGYRGDRLFAQLPNVAVGDEVILHADGESFVYVITDSSVIAPTDVKVLDNNKEEKEITMITCTIDGKERVAVSGKLKE